MIGSGEIGVIALRASASVRNERETRFAGRRYFLEGPEGREPLGGSYDEHADVLYLWRGKKPVDAISLPTDDGILVRVHPKTGELVGVTLLDFEVLVASPLVVSERQGGSSVAGSLAPR